MTDLVVIPPYTTWDDLAHLGWSREKVCKLLNAKLGGTLTCPTGVHLNDWFTERFGWSAQNVIEGPATIVSKDILLTKEIDVLEEAKNTSDQPQEVKLIGKATNIDTASLGITKRPAIHLHTTITINNVADSKFTLSVKTDSVVGSSKTTHKDIVKAYKLHVAPGETIKLVKIEYRLIRIFGYNVPYGVKGTIATFGKPYCRKRIHAFDIPKTLTNPPPSGTITLEGIHTSTLNIIIPVRSRGAGPIISKALIDLGDEHTEEIEEPLEVEIEEEETATAAALSPEEVGDQGGAIVAF